MIECYHIFLRFHCICPPGYFGTLCDLDVNECEVSPCLHEGICINTPGGFKCVCRPGYSGSSFALRWHEDQYESLKSLSRLLRPRAIEATLTQIWLSVKKKSASQYLLLISPPACVRYSACLSVKLTRDKFMSPVLSDENISVSVSCLHFIISASLVSQRYCCFTSIHLSYFPLRRISSYFSARVSLCVCVCTPTKADSCQVLGRLISFVFHTVSSIYPSPVERGGGNLWGIATLESRTWHAWPNSHRSSFYY